MENRLKYNPLIVLCTTVFVTFIFFVCCMMNGHKIDYGVSKGDVSKLRFEGEYIQIGDLEEPGIDAGEYVDASCYNSVTLKGHFSQNIKAGRELTFFLYRVNVVICKNGTEIYRHGFEDDDADAVLWDTVTAGSISTDDEITISISIAEGSTYKGAYRDFLKNIYYGSSHALATRKINANMLQIVLAIFIMIMGLAMLISAGSIKLFRQPVPIGIFTSGWLLLAGGVGSFINYAYISFIFTDAYVINMVDFIAVTCIFFFLTLHLEAYIKQEHYRLLAKVTAGVAGAIIVVAYWLEMFGIVKQSDNMEKVFPACLLIVAMEIIILIMDVYTAKVKRSKLVITATIALSLFVFLEMIYYLINGIFLMYFFETGFVIFALLQFAHLIYEVHTGIEKVQEAKALETELEQNKIAMMMSQIQPHFLNNTMVSIRELCKLDPDKAYEALGHFAKFLRSNMNSISTTDLVPFEQELEYVKHFVYLQMLRYDDDLNVQYDISVSDFSLPALVVQPLVENAIRYGVADKPGKGTVTIKTWQTGGGIYISVRDDGNGFDRKQLENDDNYTHRFHVGIANVRSRLKIQCNGTLSVESNVGLGTISTIFLPTDQKTE